jgi:hypothetical protein
LEFLKPPASPGKGELADDGNGNVRSAKLQGFFTNFLAACTKRDNSSNESGDNYNAFETLQISISSD